MRLLNRAELGPKTGIYGALWFDATSDSWKVRFMNRKDQTQSLAEPRSFEEAMEVLVSGVQGYLETGYKLTGVVTGYASPRSF